MNVPSRIEQDVEILAGRRGQKPEHAVRFKDLTVVDQRAQALAANLQRQIVAAGIPTIRDKVESVRAFLYNTITYVDNEVGGARDDLQALIDAQGVTIVNIESDVQDNAAAIVTEAAARASADTALSGQITTINANVSANAANITNEQVARVNADNAIAADITTLETDFAAAEASITENASALSTLEGYAAATYTLRVKAGTGGAQLELVAADDPILGAQSALRLAADNILLDGSVFAVHIDTDSLAASNAFITALTSETAFINNLTVGTGRIDTLQLAGNAATAAAFSQKTSGSYGAGMSTAISAGAQNISIPASSAAKILVVASFQQGYVSGARDWGFRIRRTFNGVTTTLLTRLNMSAINDYPTVALLDTVTNIVNPQAERSVLYQVDWYGENALIELQKANTSIFAGWR